MGWDSDKTVFRVVVNAEDQYSVWPDYKPLPPGWRDIGVVGTKQACLDHIDAVWVDMRPLSLRQHMTQQAGS